MSDKNPDLLAVSKTLNELSSRIHAKKGNTDDPKLYSALNKELVEINHRITMVGGLIFRQRAKSITAAADKVQASKAEIVRAIEQLDKINSFIKTVSGFLGLVDKVIDIAKRLP